MRHLLKVAALSLAAVLGIASASTSGMAATVIKVSLEDKGADMEMPTGLGIGMNGDMAKATMSIVATPATAKAGEVTFEVTNASKDTIHEMLVFPIANETTQLPFIAAENRLDEEAAGDLGEVSELDPGKSGALTLDLKPGKYALICNVPGHYMAAMWTIITVTQ